MKVLGQPNGDLLVVTTAGLVLPIHGAAQSARHLGANVRPGTFYPAAASRRSCSGAPMSPASCRGGQIGANITLRDTTLPTDQAELDEFSQNLASRFDDAGADAVHRSDRRTCRCTAVPPPPVQSGYVGFAATIQVNPAVQADAVAGA